MRSTRFTLLMASAIMLAACDDDGGVVLAPEVPLAYTRFVHAVSDTGPTDWRFIDQIEYTPIELGMEFRDFSAYQATAPGERHLRIFPTSTDINITSQHLIDTTITFEPNTYYTIIHLGFARPGQNPADRIVVIQDDIDTPAAGQIAIRALHLASGAGAIDVFATAEDSDPIPAQPLFDNLAYEGITTYQTRAAGEFALQATPSTATTPVMAAAMAPPGEAAVPQDNLTAIGGSTIAGSAILAIFMPASVAGSEAPDDDEFEAPAWVYIIDRHPR